MLDYEILRLIWWALLGTLLMGFAVLDGFDLGVATLLPFIGKTDEERRILLNTVGPVWEGNQVWLILGAGASFAAWPALYAVSFSGFYYAMFLALFTIILRPVGFKFRSKMPHASWRFIWDKLLFLGGAIPAFVFGVAFGNLFLGVPFSFDETLRSTYHGGFFDLLTPFPLLCGLAGILMVVMQGASYLTLKTQAPLMPRARKILSISSLLMAFAFIGLGFWALFHLKGYTITSEINPHGPSNPAHKMVACEAKAWLQNFKKYPHLWAIPGLAVFSLLCAFLFNQVKKQGLAFISSSLAVFTMISTCGIMLFPFLLPSSFNPQHSLTVWDASSSRLTLFVMLLATLVFLPIIIGYTIWLYRVFKGPVTKQTLKSNATQAY